jgi:hypothetical protein
MNDSQFTANTGSYKQNCVVMARFYMNRAMKRYAQAEEAKSERSAQMYNYQGDYDNSQAQFYFTQSITISRRFCRASS